MNIQGLSQIQKTILCFTLHTPSMYHFKRLNIYEKQNILYIGKNYVDILLISGITMLTKNIYDSLLHMISSDTLYVSNTTRKPVFGVFDQVRLKPACYHTI